MKKKARDYFRLLRPRQWIKNFAITTALLFSGRIFEYSSLWFTISGFLIFCAISSSIYIINDIFDIQKDKLHPFKRFRPLAHGDIPISNALILSVILAILSLIGSITISIQFFVLTIVYLLLQLSYSMFLKHIAVIDILALACGYILRVYAGEIVIGYQYHISVWLLLTVISLSLFLAVGKRKRELSLVSEHNSTNIAAIRQSLSHYSEKLLDVYASIFATSTFISYALFTFLETSQQRTVSNDIFLPQFLPQYLQKKWLMLTIIPVVYGLMRYLQDIYEKHEGESPERVLFTDKSLLTTVIIWAVMVFIIIYIIGGQV